MDLIIHPFKSNKQKTGNDIHHGLFGARGWPLLSLDSAGAVVEKHAPKTGGAMYHCKVGFIDIPIVNCYDSPWFIPCLIMIYRDLPWFYHDSTTFYHVLTMISPCFNNPPRSILPWGAVFRWLSMGKTPKSLVCHLQWFLVHWRSCHREWVTWTCGDQVAIRSGQREKSRYPPWN